jgi:hypothetical protein
MKKWATGEDESASISPSGALIMRELHFHDVGAFADRPLIAIHEVTRGLPLAGFALASHP